MVHNLTYTASILEAISVLSSFSLSDSIWDSYEKHATPKMEDVAIRLRGSLHYVKDLSPDQAGEGLRSLDPIVPILHKMQEETLRAMVQPKHQRFKNAALDFFNAMDELHDNLQDVAEIHASYKMSMDVLAKDWDSEADAHWDNY